MSAKPPTATRVWWMIFPVLVGAGAFALGGIGPGVFALVLAGICSAVAARFDRRLRVRASDRTSTRPREEVSERDV
jgi:amino acid permease